MNEGIIHRLPSGSYVVACRDGDTGQWYSPVAADDARRTGCHTYYASSLEGLGANQYKTQRRAIQAAENAGWFGPEVQYQRELERAEGRERRHGGDS